MFLGSSEGKLKCHRNQGHSIILIVCFQLGGKFLGKQHLCVRSGVHKCSMMYALHYFYMYICSIFTI